MNIKVAKNSGFCFGVKRAMMMAWKELEEAETEVYALGPLIHNKQAVDKYEEKGLITVNEIENIPSTNTMIIRSHGVCEDVYLNAESKKINVVDTTCPFVKKIHNIARDYSNKGYKIILLGDKNHPEVIGINGWCNNSAIIIKTVEELNDINFDNNHKYCVVAQTTINVDKYNEIVSILNTKLDNIILNNTICSATKVRQSSAKELAQEVDCMVVIGGKHSSNTQKLVNICNEYTKTYAIEVKEDLNIDELKNFKTIGVTAGASTPDWIIKDVIEFLETL